MKASRTVLISITVSAIISAWPCFSSNQAFAADAYQWQDSSGTTFFGSKPPSDARNVTLIEGKSFSKYSSDKLIRSHAKRADTVRAESPRAALKESNMPLPPAPSEPTVPFPDQAAPAKLEQGKLSITHNPSQQVTACKVTVRNSGNEIAKKVLVSFEFEDGAIVQGSGPETIAAKSEAVYFIGAEHLPINVKRQTPKTETGLSYAPPPKPKVIIQSNAE